MVDSKLLITAVIPTYRRPQLLRRAVLSVLNQTYPYLKVCVYNDASGDETRLVLEELMRRDQRVFYYEHPYNVGPFDNFELGIKQVSTPYFSVLSDDDVLLPEFYAQAMEGFNRYPEAAFVATKTLVVKENQIVDILFDVDDEKYYVPPAGLTNISLGKTNTWTGTVYRQTAVSDINLDRLMPGEPVEQDFLMRVVAEKSYLVRPVPGAIFTIHNSSMSSSRRSDNVIQRYRRLFAKIKNYPNISDSDKELVIKNAKYILAKAVWERGLLDLREGNFDLTTKIAQILRCDLDQVMQSALLYFTAKIFKSNKLTYLLCTNLYTAWKKLNFKRLINRYTLNDVYGSYLQYLEKYNVVE